MNENFKISPSEINKIKVLNQKDKNFRLESLKLFNQQGFPTRNHEDWKFSDINQIFSKNFQMVRIRQKGQVFVFYILEQFPCYY